MKTEHYSLYVNITQRDDEKPHILRSIEIDLDDINFTHPQTLEAKIKEAKHILFVKEDFIEVPRDTPFYLGLVIVWPLANQVELMDLIDRIMNGMDGYLFHGKEWCDAISVIRDAEDKKKDLRIRIAWKDHNLPHKIKNHPLFSKN